jgi:hypothetical protein
MRIMRLNRLNIIMLVAGFSILAFSCRKKDDPINSSPTATTASMDVNFINVAGYDSLKLNSVTYTNGSNESFTVSTYKYYISNVKLIGDGVADYAEPESYHLVNAADPNSGHVHLQVPFGKYKAISFMIGVDSARNVSGAQTGALDPMNDMFWTWNTGYIMAKFEGKSPASTLSDNSFKFHIGGFKGSNSVLRTVALDLPSEFILSQGATSMVDIRADILKWFTPSLISLAALNTVNSEGPTAVKIANNYANMFSLDMAMIVVE